MRKNIVLFIVGHSKWGKSTTLTRLKNGVHQKKRVTLNGVEWRVKSMSNDDDSSGLLDFFNALDSDRWKNVIAALCPSFGDNQKRTQAIINAAIKKGYKIVFWVIKFRWNSKEEITSQELHQLRKSGIVELYTGKEAGEKRANKLRRHIRSLH